MGATDGGFSANNKAAQFTVREHILSAPRMEAGLYIVATPIGNLGDITIRALETLAGCDVIACEDTRTTGVLLKRYGIDRPRISYTEHNAEPRGAELLHRIERGEAVALVSDAGTPLVSDPGSRLVARAVATGINVTPLPGASAPIAALMGCGLAGLDHAGDDFRFAGFLPSKQGARRKRIEHFMADDATVLFFEGPSRVAKSLSDMAFVLGGDRPAVVARELTKMHETFHRGTLDELAAEFAAMERVRGEIVIVLAPAPPHVPDADNVDALLLEALAVMKTKQAAKQVAEQTGLPSQQLYARALELKNNGNG